MQTGRGSVGRVCALLDGCSGSVGLVWLISRGQKSLPCQSAALSGQEEHVTLQCDNAVLRENTLDTHYNILDATLVEAFLAFSNELAVCIHDIHWFTRGSFIAPDQFFNLLLQQCNSALSLSPWLSRRTGGVKVRRDAPVETGIFK